MLGIEPVSHGTSENLKVRVQNDPSDEVGIEYESLLLGDKLDYNTGIVSNQFEDVLFAFEAGSAFEANVRNARNLDENEVQWSLPKLKTPETCERGDAISQSLASLVNTACTNLCQTNEIVEKYKVPVNCEAMCPPAVNEEIWADLTRSEEYKVQINHLKIFRVW